MTTFAWDFSTRVVYLDGSDNPAENGWVGDATLTGAWLHTPGQPSRHLSVEEAEAICDHLGISIARLEQDEGERAAERALFHGRDAA